MCAHREVVLYQLVCRYEPCGKVFYICRSCFRGHAYCSYPCFKANRDKQCREANRRHQESEEGRLDHNQRQQQLYQRQVAARSGGNEKNLTDRSSQTDCDGVTMNFSDSRELRSTKTEFKEPQEVHDDKREAYPRCRICNRKGYWVDTFHLVGIEYARPRSHRKNPASVPRRTLENRDHS
jgi:ribosomal protein S14